MVAGPLREVVVYGRHVLLCDGWKYYDQLKGKCHAKSLVGYFESDREAIQAWLDMLGVQR